MTDSPTNPLAGFPPADMILTESEVDAGLDRLAASVQERLAGGEVLLLGVMNGGMFPLVHLAERLAGDFRIDYCHASRYRGELRGADLHWIRKPGEALSGKTVIVVDDIWDEGRTLAAVAAFCRDAGAHEVLTAVLFVKDRPRDPAIGLPDIDAGLHVPNRYVFGCGMDMQHRWRHLRSVYALQSEGV